jgi:uncharacterized protein
LRLYLDSSALVKLVQQEAESDVLREYLLQFDAGQMFTSSLARVEVVRAVAAGGDQAIDQARRLLSGMDQVAMTTDLLDTASTLGPELGLRSLDAIHLASAQLSGADLEALVTYDPRMATAATALCLPIEHPIP